MADVTQKILIEADSHSLISLDEFKVATGMPAGPSSTDAQTQWLIDTQSHVIARMCNRIFAKETLIETWRDLGCRRLYLTHWPVKEDDIESVTTNGTDRIDWELDEREGKLSLFTARNEPVMVEYTGGYELPDEAPLPLKHAAMLLASTTKSELSAASLTGVRMISHKESRVMFHSPTTGGSSTSGASASQTQATVEALLRRYVKQWI